MPEEAEREGFEPARELAPPTRLAGECLQPLGHLSGGAFDSTRASEYCPPVATEERTDREALKARYDAILATATPPFAFVDLDAMRRNARRMLEQAGGLPIRVASKSVRSTEVLSRIFDLDPGFRGVLAFTVAEALHLAERGFEDLVVAYPSVDRAAIGRVARLAAETQGRAPVLMVDDRPHLDLIEALRNGLPGIRSPTPAIWPS